MLILSRVCALFRDKNGEKILTIGPADRMTFIDAPEAIKQDPLFDMLVAEGSLECVKSEGQKKSLEKDPELGHDATGAIASENMPAEALSVDEAGKTVRKSKSKAKTEATEGK